MIFILYMHVYVILIRDDFGYLFRSLDRIRSHHRYIMGFLSFYFMY